MAKGVCLLHGIDVRTQDCVPAYPNPDDGMAKLLETIKPGSKGTVPVTNFGPISNLYKAHLKSLCNNLKASIPQRNRLLAAYELLGRTIRNRDAHAYVPKVRAEHFDLVKDLFIPSINDLLSWIQLSAGELNAWSKDGQQFIDSLDLTSDQKLADSICNEVATRKKRVNLTSKRLQNLTADDLDRVMSFLDQLEASDTAS